MARQGEKTEIGLIEWDFDEGKFDIWVDDVLIVDDGRCVHDKKQFIVEARTAAFKVHRKINNHFKGYEIGCPDLYSRHIYADELGPGVAQIPFFATNVKPNKNASKIREERINYLIKKYPQYHTWLIYLTDIQHTGWHKFAKKFGFVETKEFFNPNSENIIKEYTYVF